MKLRQRKTLNGGGQVDQASYEQWFKGLGAEGLTVEGGLQ